MINIGEKIKTIRESLKIKQIEIAEKLGLEQSNYARLEKRENKITIEQLQQIANVFGMSVTDIINYPNMGGASNQELEKVKGELETLKLKIKELEKYNALLESSLKDKDKIIQSLELLLSYQKK